MDGAKAGPPDGGESASGLALLFLTGKAFLQPFHAPILLKLPQGAGAEHFPRPVIHIQQPRPQFRVVAAKVTQIFNPLQRNLRRHHPELWARLLDMDNRAREMFGPGPLGQFKQNWSVERLEERFAREEKEGQT